MVTLTRLKSKNNPLESLQAHWGSCSIGEYDCARMSKTSIHGDPFSWQIQAPFLARDDATAETNRASGRSSGVRSIARDRPYTVYWYEEAIINPGRIASVVKLGRWSTTLNRRVEPVGRTIILKRREGVRPRVWPSQCECQEWYKKGILDRRGPCNLTTAVRSQEEYIQRSGSSADFSELASPRCNARSSMLPDVDNHCRQGFPLRPIPAPLYLT